MADTFHGFTYGETAYFNGVHVKLIRIAATRDGATWRVKSIDPKDKHCGELFDIEPGLLHLLVRNQDQ